MSLVRLTIISIHFQEAIMRMRRDVSQLPAGDDTLEWYGKAVLEMKARPTSDPRNWENQAAVHRDLCQHGTSFFLPWHRMYLLHFERIVADHVASLGGPSDWALPYWHYDLAVPATLALPPAFREEFLADGTTPNPLYVAERNPDANAGHTILTVRDVGLRGSLISAQAAFFGGVAPAHAGSLAGTIERVPHNAVHVAVGDTGDDFNQGWMIDPDLAALDPIFWLHHSNIDRLWQVWLNCDPAHENLASTYWRTGVTFQFDDSTATRVTMRTIDVLDTTVAALDYRYEDDTCPVPFRAPPPGPGPAPLGTSVSAMAANTPELVGATLSAVKLGDQVAHVELPTPVTPRAFSAASGRRPAPLASARQLVEHVTLQLENVISHDLAPTYDVFLNVPDGSPNDHDDRFVGRVARILLMAAGVTGRSRSQVKRDRGRSRVPSVEV